MSEPVPPPARGFTFWFWIFIRLFWVVFLALPIAVLGLLSGIPGLFLRPGAGLEALIWGGAGAYAVWAGGRQAWRAIRGTAYPAPMTMRDEIGGCLGLAALFALGLAIVWPSFGSLVKKSAEGANKGNLAMLRQDLADYQAKHGRPPAGLDELGGARPKPFRLWSYKAGTGHKTSENWRLTTDAASADSGEFAYRLDASTVQIYIDCTHTDSRGAIWTAY